MDILFSKESKGCLSDLSFIKEGKWLKDSEVRYYISCQKGRWYLTMLYIWIENPLQFMSRFIDHYDSEKKATIYAELFQRGIRKDARGTLKVKNNHAISICFN
jgi:hypothetical protein